jgi:hypothetical protein
MGERLMPLALALTLTASLLLGAAAPTWAGDSQVEFVPEVNAYLRLSDRTRLFLLGSLTQGLTEAGTDGEVGIHLDVTLAPILRRWLREADWERDRYLWVRVGYRLVGSLDDREDGFTEHRGILEATGRVPLPFEVWLVNRGRVDPRDVDGDFSARLRYRLGIEREFTVSGETLVPYAQAEVFYDTRFGAWSRQRYQGGVEIALTEHWRIEPYYARQEDQRSSPVHLDRVGLVLKLYW